VLLKIFMMEVLNAQTFFEYSVSTDMSHVSFLFLRTRGLLFHHLLLYTLIYAVHKMAV
jgi:hypothetical protein